MFRRTGLYLGMILALLYCHDLKGVCACSSTLGANNKKGDDSFWTAGNCLAGQHISSCNNITGDGDCTLNCNGCDYQATDGAGLETGCFTDNGCTTTPCTSTPELSSPSEIWRSLKNAWVLLVQ